jgi:hypothetical protein
MRSGRWTDVAGWPAWDVSKEIARLDGPFEPGARGWAKQRGNLGGPFTITAVDPGRRWVSACPVPLGTITFEHLLEPAAAGYVKVVKRADVQGGTGPLLRLLAPRMRRDTAASFAALQQRVCHRWRGPRARCLRRSAPAAGSHDVRAPGRIRLLTRRSRPCE